MSILLYVSLVLSIPFYIEFRFTLVFVVAADMDANIHFTSTLFDCYLCRPTIHWPTMERHFTLLHNVIKNLDKNSSGDEIANVLVNDDITHT